MIGEPINDWQCLDQVTHSARSLYLSDDALRNARRLGSRKSVIEWIQDKPQTDDTGQEDTQYIQCDVAQRLRLFAPDPNCIERARDAMILLESLEYLVLAAPADRALATIEVPARGRTPRELHTGLVEKRGKHWYAVDLFPRRRLAQRNASWTDQGIDSVRFAHSNIGKPALQYVFGKSVGGTAADVVGSGENALFGLVSKRRPPTKQPAPPALARAQSTQRERPGATSQLGQGEWIGSNQETAGQPAIRGGSRSATPQPARDPRRYDRTDDDREEEAEDRDDRGSFGDDEGSQRGWNE